MVGNLPGRTVLTDDDVHAAWEEYQAHVSCAELAERYEVSWSTLWRRFVALGLRVERGRHCRRPAEPGGRPSPGGPYMLLMQYYRR